MFIFDPPRLLRRAFAIGSLIAGVGAAGSNAWGAAADPALPRYRPQAIDLPKTASYLTPEGKIRVVGYNDMLEMLTALDEIFTGYHPQLTFELELKGTRTAPPALTEGQSAMAPMGAEFSDEALAEYRRRTGADPVMLRIAHDSLSPKARSSPLAIYVNRDNPLSVLTMAQAARIFTARRTQDVVARWGDLGIGGKWSQLPIHALGMAAETALGTFMREHKFDGLPFAPEFQSYGQSADVIRHVGEDRLAIGFADLNLATSDVKILAISEHSGQPPSRGTESDILTGRYPLDRYLLIYVRRDPGQPIDPVVREYLRLVLSYEGQAAIAGGKLGYLPLNPSELRSERAKLD